MTWKEDLLARQERRAEFRADLQDLHTEMVQAHELGEDAEKEVLDTFGKENSEFIHGARLVTQMWARKLLKILNGFPSDDEEEAAEEKDTEEEDPKAPKNPL